MLNNKDDVQAWLDQYKISDYIINDDNLTVDVYGNVDLTSSNLTSINVLFNKVTGNFYCNNNQLTFLDGCPKYVGGNFDCSINQLISLEGCPQLILGDFHCYTNKLTSLIGGTQSIGGDFYCNNNLLTSLHGSPQSGVGDFWCGNNPIKNLNNFACQFSENFTHDGFIIEELKDYYTINKNNELELKLTYNELKSILLYDKLNNNIEQKNNNTKKIKI